MRRHSSRHGLPLALALSAVLIVAVPAFGAVRATAPNDPAPATPGAPPVRISTPEGATAARPYSVDLYRPGLFVTQANFVQCVGASMQMMLNIVGPGVDTTAVTQLRLFTLARSFRGTATTESQGADPLRPRRGASAQGWAQGLTVLGAGPYRVVALPTLDAALSAAAHAIVTTGQPVGLLVWQGQHAWVMNGFVATGDPARDPSARVTGVRVLDPLYPYGSGSWGPTPAPDSLLSIPRLSRTFVPYRPHGHNVAWRNRYVLVLPYWRTAAMARTAKAT